MSRFLLLTIPAVLLVMAVFGFALEGLGLEPEAGPLARLGLARSQPPGRLLLGTWALEAVALTALFLLIQGRSGSWWLDGLAAGWIAWVFRGPVLVLTVAAWSRLPREPWWPLAVRWLLLYTLCGLVIAAIARRQGLGR